jgi:hypothetical protein
MNAGEPRSDAFPVSGPQSTSDGWLIDLRLGLIAYYLTSLIAVLGVLFGHDYLKPAPHSLAKGSDEIAAFANWDGQWYVKILENGYRYDPAQPSSVAFFPAFPILGRWLADATGLRPDTSLLIIAHLGLAGTFILLARYVRMRRLAMSPALAGWVVVGMGLWPTTFFCRMAYSESLFLLCVLAALYGMERGWPLAVIALVCGLATATRSLGVCLLAPYAVHVLYTSTGWRHRTIGLGLVPVTCWGLLAFMVFQHWEFGDALAFARTQENWRVRPAIPWTTKIGDLLTLEPIRALFDPGSACYWQRSPAEISPLFSLHCANPVYWLTAIALVGVGAWKRWLTTYELTLALGLLLVPYGLRSHEMCMAGMGRFTAVVFPIYIVLGHLLVRMPGPLTAMLLGLCAFFLGTYAAFFAAWWRFF